MATESTGDKASKWMYDLITQERKDGTHAILPKAYNYVKILENDEFFRGRFKKNTLSDQYEYDGRQLRDEDSLDVVTYMEKRWIDGYVAKTTVYDAIESTCSRHPYNPIVDYLRSLKWDGKHRIPSFFSDHCGVDITAYSLAVAKSMFISAVARAMDPGCKVDTMVVLEGVQGAGKSSLFEVLFGEWYAEINANVESKDFFESLRNIWCADFGELVQFSKAEVTRVKQVLTQRVDHYRPSYGRAVLDHPRRCIFVGGTNEDHWLRDPTGSRRFLPVRVHGPVNLQAVAEERDQLWAEAVYLYQSREVWWDVPGAQEEQEKRFDQDSWEIIIEDWLRTKTNIEPTTADILCQALDIPVGRQTRADSTRAGHVLRRLGWAPKQKWMGGRKYRVYVKL